MELYIHFGIYKTASSFLQTYCANNRDWLEKNNFFFPPSKREGDMLAGRISPGNGNDITIFLSKLNKNKVRQIIGEWKHDASKKSCTKVLISDEALIHAFAKSESLLLLNDVIVELGFSKVYCLGFFRNIVDHCLSTYKHRAKKARISSFSQWVETTYETPKVLSGFFSGYQMVDFNWDFQWYNKDGRVMADYFFEQWLLIDKPAQHFNMSVNPSLSLSEIAALYALGTQRMDWVKYVYDAWLGLSKNQKADDWHLENNYRSVAAKILGKHESVFKWIDGFLPSGSSLFSQAVINSNEFIDSTIHLSPKQVATMVVAIEVSRKPMEQFKRFVKKLLFKVGFYEKKVK